MDETRSIFRARGIPVRAQAVGAMFTLFFTDKPVQNFTHARSTDSAFFKKFFHQMLVSGIYVPPSKFESHFVSAAHGEFEFKRTLEAFKKL